jgi:hypothetical protein
VNASYGNRYFIDGLLLRHSLTIGDFEPRSHFRAAAAYQISAEPWFQVPGLNDLVLRYAFGTAGEDGYLLNDYLQGGGVPAVVREHEFGVSATLLQQRLSAVVSFAKRTSEEHRGRTSYPQVLPASSTEVGGTWEASLHARLVSRQDLDVGVSAVFDRMRSRITEYEGGCIRLPLTRHCKDERPGDLWVKDHVRSFEQLPPWLLGRRDEFQVNDDGYLVWVGLGNDIREGVSKRLWGTSMQVNGITYRWGEPFFFVSTESGGSLTNAGSALPDFGYGLAAHVRWRNLTVRTELRGQVGGKVYNRAKMRLYAYARHADIDQAGRPEDLKKPVTYYLSLLGNDDYSTTFVEDATYLRVGALSAQYRFQNEQLRKLFGDRLAPRELALELTGRNLLTFTGYSGFDPEVGPPLDRIERLNLPQLRTLTATAQVRF